MTEAEIAAYIDGTLSGPSRERAEAHLASCVECRYDLVESQKVLRGMRRPRKAVIVGTLAAAAVATFLIARPSATPVEREPVVRSDGVAVLLRAYGPIGPTARAGLRFVWAEAPGAQSYRLTVSRENGVGVWSSSGTDTVATLPDSVTLNPSERYFWVSDALLSDGATRSTGLREFGVAR
jgi:anti-sigma factor RsiW